MSVAGNILSQPKSVNNWTVSCMDTSQKAPLVTRHPIHHSHHSSHLNESKSNQSPNEAYRETLAVLRGAANAANIHGL